MLAPAPSSTCSGSRNSAGNAACSRPPTGPSDGDAEHLDRTERLDRRTRVDRIKPGHVDQRLPDARGDQRVRQPRQERRRQLMAQADHGPQHDIDEQSGRDRSADWHTRRDGQELTHLNLRHNVRTKVGVLQYRVVLTLLLGSLLVAGAQRSSPPRASAPQISQAGRRRASGPAVIQARPTPRRGRSHARRCVRPAAAR